MEPRISLITLGVADLAASTGVPHTDQVWRCLIWVDLRCSLLLPSCCP